MQKMKLQIDDLMVESFDTAAKRESARGTVQGNENVCCCCCCCPCCCGGGTASCGGTCEASCNGTCIASCNGTCDASCGGTCVASCNATCGGYYPSCYYDCATDGRGLCIEQPF
jgi:hypothetical protein